jgi:quercetin dioxygenase-like cupin family protein
MSSFPETIDNGGSETLTFVRLVPTETGERLDVEVRARPHAGPPMHVHYLQEEAMTVTEGRMGYQILGQPERFAGPGESVVFPAGVAHRWWNAGAGDLTGTGWMTPPLNGRYFLTALFDSIKRSGGRRPGLLDVAFLLTRYRSEFGMLVIPPLVQRILFPVLFAIGKAVGAHRRFADAPEPWSAERVRTRGTNARV